MTRILLLCALLGGLLAGCSVLSSGGAGSVSEVHLFGLPVTLNLDGKPGTDGFAVRIYVSKGGRARGETVRSGVLEALMFDGVVGTQEIAARTPTQVWRFTPRELHALGEMTSLGQSYRFALRWDEPPKQGHITVVARYVPEKGDAVYSSPSTISSAVK